MIDQRRVLIVRVWWEYDFLLAALVMRGSLQRLGSESPRYFNSFEALFELLRDALPTPSDSRDGPPTDVS